METRNANFSTQCDRGIRFLTSTVRILRWPLRPYRPSFAFSRTDSKISWFPFAHKSHPNATVESPGRCVIVPQTSLHPLTPKFQKTSRYTTSADWFDIYQQQKCLTRDAECKAVRILFHEPFHQSALAAARRSAENDRLKFRHDVGVWKTRISRWTTTTEAVDERRRMKPAVTRTLSRTKC